jgi:hypothetical protein
MLLVELNSCKLVSWDMLYLQNSYLRCSSYGIRDLYFWRWMLSQLTSRYGWRYRNLIMNFMPTLFTLNFYSIISLFYRTKAAFSNYFFSTVKRSSRNAMISCSLKSVGVESMSLS